MNGVTPTTISTSPNWADSDAQIMSQASDSSKPAVRQSPWTTARVGKRQVLDPVGERDQLLGELPRLGS